MAGIKNKNNFFSYQKKIVETNSKRIQDELKDLRGRSGIRFKDLASLVRHISKLTGINRTTLTRNSLYKTMLRELLAGQKGATSLVNIDDASPELLRAMINERDMTIGRLSNQIRILNLKIDQDSVKQGDHVVAATDVALSSPVNADAAFQDTAFALLQLIQQLNQHAGVETIKIDEDENLILDMAVVNPRKRREMAIGPERTKSFIKWLKANKHLL